MLETFLILLSGGVMLAAAISDSRAVTLHWLRLCGILALVFAGLALFFARMRVDAGRWIALASAVAICGQLACTQVEQRGGQRIFAIAAGACAVVAGAIFVRAPIDAWTLLACVGIAALCGLTLMDMLLGHAYLTASKMTMAPFRRLNLAVAIALSLRAVLSVSAIMIERTRPVEMFWQREGLLVGMRWFVGLLVPAVFIYMAHDCIKRRATQSATGILYVAGVLIFIGEIVALQLVRETGLPF